MNPKDVTVITAVDAAYLPKLMAVIRTWERFKSNILHMPMIIMCDESIIPNATTASSPADINGDALTTDPGRTLLALAMTRAIRGRLEVGDAGWLPPITLVPWSMPEAENQREKMLTALVWGAAEHVKTPWYLKIDADTVATSNSDWMDEQWFKPDVSGELPAFITNPWGYTKPPQFLDALDEWAEGVPELADGPPVERIVSDDGKRAYHDRIISWLFFGNTEWTKEVVSLLKTKQLPVPSQDTFLHYCAQRMKRRYLTARMKQYGWNHLGRWTIARVKEECKRLLND